MIVFVFPLFLLGTVTPSLVRYIMENTENWALKDPYKDYDEALDSLVLWMHARYEWINNALE